MKRTKDPYKNLFCLVCQTSICLFLFFRWHGVWLVPMAGTMAQTLTAQLCTQFLMTERSSTGAEGGAPPRTCSLLPGRGITTCT